MQINKIHKGMTFGELLSQFPKAGQVLMNYGMHCIGCHIAVSETIAQGAMAHGMDEKTIDEMIQVLNTKAVN